MPGQGDDPLHADVAIEYIGHFGSAPFRVLANLRSWAGEAAAAQAPACRLDALAGELLRPDPRTQAELAFAFARWTAAVRGALEELRDQGGLRPDADPEYLPLLASLHAGGLIARTARYGCVLALGDRHDARLHHTGLERGPSPGSGTRQPPHPT